MPQEEEIELLANLPLISELEEEVLRIIAFSSDSRDLQAGEILVRRGDRSDAGYLVVLGTLGLFRAELAGEPESIVGPGGLLGEMALLAGTEWQVTAVARDAARVMKIPRTLFQRVLREYPGSAARLRSALEKRLREFTGALGELYPDSVGR